jgi:hypothetical protein
MAMKMMMRVVSMMAAAGLAASMTVAAPGGGGVGGGGRGAGGAAGAARGPAPTLKTPTTPTTVPDEDGFIRRWILLEPITGAQGTADNAVQAMVKKEYFPGQFTAVPRDGDKVNVNGADLTWHACDTSRYSVNVYHFAYALGRPTENILVWAVTVVNSPEEMKDVRLAIGSNDASVWWLNGQEVVGIYGDRQIIIDDGVSKRLTLKSGPNVIRVAVHNQRGATDFCARLLDKDDNPIRNLTVSLSADGR